MDYRQMDDYGLLRMIATAESAALDALYERYGRLVYSLALYILNDPAAAEEVTQDVFVQVWNKAETYQPEQGKVATWLTSVARYRAIDVLRRTNVRPEGHRADLDDGTGFELRDEMHVEALVEQNQERSQVNAALAQLPPEQRRALAYAYFFGYSHQQIADLLGEPLGTVKTRIRLAMQKLRQMLKED